MSVETPSPDPRAREAKYVADKAVAVDMALEERDAAGVLLVGEVAASNFLLAAELGEREVTLGIAKDVEKAVDNPNARVGYSGGETMLTHYQGVAMKSLRRESESGKLPPSSIRATADRRARDMAAAEMLTRGHGEGVDIVTKYTDVLGTHPLSASENILRQVNGVADRHTAARDALEAEYRSRPARIAELREQHKRTIRRRSGLHGTSEG